MQNSSSEAPVSSPWLVQMARAPSGDWLIANYGESDREPTIVYLRLASQNRAASKVAEDAITTRINHMK